GALPGGASACLRGEDRLKRRVDVALVERGLAESRAQAQALVMAGRVPGYDKPGQQVDDDAELRVDRGPQYVSRGGEKLANRLDRLRAHPAGLDRPDVGPPTGGVTDVLPPRGAAPGNAPPAGPEPPAPPRPGEARRGDL